MCDYANQGFIDSVVNELKRLFMRRVDTIKSDFSDIIRTYTPISNQYVRDLTVIEAVFSWIRMGDSLCQFVTLDLNLLDTTLTVLQDEFEAAVDEESIQVLIPNVTLTDGDDEWYFGDYFIYLNALGYVNSQSYDVTTESSRAQLSGTNYIHPHISNNELCEGDGEHGIQNALMHGDLVTFYLLVQAVVTNYCAEGAYKKLSAWYSSPCNCGRTDDTYICDNCNNTMCDSCSSFCTACESMFCADCVYCCDSCSQSYCYNCAPQNKCDKCNAEVCPDCIDACNCCGESVCKGCATECPGCNDIYCDDCLRECEICGDLICADCMETCRECDIAICDDCAVEVAAADSKQLGLFADINPTTSSQYFCPTCYDNQKELCGVPL